MPSLRAKKLAIIQNEVNWADPIRIKQEIEADNIRIPVKK